MELVSLTASFIAVFISFATLIYDIQKNKAELTFKAFGGGSCGRVIMLDITNAGNRVAKNIKINNISITNNTYNGEPKDISFDEIIKEGFSLAPGERYRVAVGNTEGTCKAILSIDVKYNKFGVAKRQIPLQNYEMTLNGVANGLCNIAKSIDKLNKEEDVYEN